MTNEEFYAEMSDLLCRMPPKDAVNTRMRSLLYARAAMLKHDEALTRADRAEAQRQALHESAVLRKERQLKVRLAVARARFNELHYQWKIRGEKGAEPIKSAFLVAHAGVEDASHE